MECGYKQCVLTLLCGFIWIIAVTSGATGMVMKKLWEWSLEEQFCYCLKGYDAFSREMYRQGQFSIINLDTCLT